jgi:hypothetical protein
MGRLMGTGFDSIFGGGAVLPANQAVWRIKYVPDRKKYQEQEEKKRRDQAQDEFKKAALAGVVWRAHHQEAFTTDDVWTYLEAFKSDVASEPRVLGYAMRHAKAEGLIIPTDEYKRSRRRKNHGRMVRVWRSLVYGQRTVERTEALHRPDAEGGSLGDRGAEGNGE